MNRTLSLLVGVSRLSGALEIKRLAPDTKVAIVAKTHPIRSHSVAAQGALQPV
ncbi:hypothetical protein NON20_11680 [Synechocystis sp. B12]|nr:hypothetical protein NON20_11680 [Synechocystis sp. B12]